MMKKTLLLTIAMLSLAMAAQALERIEVGGLYYVLNESTREASVVAKDAKFNSYKGVVSVRSSVQHKGVNYKVISVGAKAFCNCSALTRVDLPNTIEIIGQFAFEKSSITEITLPNSVKSIYFWAFQNCTKLKKITIGSKCNLIEGSAFNGCTSLKSVICLNEHPALFIQEPFNSSHFTNVTVTVPKGTKASYKGNRDWKRFANIVEANYDFEYNGLYYNITGPHTVEVTYRDENFNSYSGDVVIPETVTNEGINYNVTAIGAKAFQQCSLLKSVKIPSSVTRSGSYAFFNCTSLTRVDISSLEAWCKISFESTAYASPLFYAKHLYLNGTEVTRVTIPSGIEELGPFLFYYCQGLKSVTIPNSVKSVGWSCFNDCSNLQTVTMGEGMKTITNHAFGDCPKLKSIVCEATTPPTMKDMGVFDDATYANAKLEVPESAMSAYKSTNWWNKFTNIRRTTRFVKNGISYRIIGNRSVEVTYWDKSLSRKYTGSVDIPEKVRWNGISYDVKAIGDSAFAKCTHLTSVVIPPSVIRIGNLAFQGCIGLYRVTIPQKVATIGSYAFRGCAGLKYVRSLAPQPPVIKSTTFDKATYTKAMLEIPRQCKSTYSKAPYWKYFKRCREIQ